ncbi:uncharacterized protein V1516DRAFT_671600 [Lipomyces oligophaga]|uniref:uncharacterized protein n=1 Tax=Lipomyces oligophaga TaxID=45792 RepID=UPI0034CD52C6
MSKKRGIEFEFEKKKKAVYRPVLDNPAVRLQWPTVGEEERELFVDLLIKMLGDVRSYTTSESSKPDILSYLTLGLNNTTKELELQVPLIYTADNPNKHQTQRLKSKIIAVFVARADILPAILFAHLPMLTVSASGRGPAVKLVQLPKGAMQRLEEASGIARLDVIGIREGYKSATSELMKSALERIEPVKPTWGRAQPKYQTLKIKHIKTTMATK